MVSLGHKWFLSPYSMSSLLMKWVNRSVKVHYKTCPVDLLNHKSACNPTWRSMLEHCSIWHIFKFFGLLYHGYINIIDWLILQYITCMQPPLKLGHGWVTIHLCPYINAVLISMLIAMSLIKSNNCNLNIAFWSNHISKHFFSKIKFLLDQDKISEYKMGCNF